MSLTSTASALPSTARSMAWGPLAGAAAALAVITVGTRPWEGHRLSLSAVRLAVALSAVAAAFGVDDTAAVTVAASPTPLSRRRTTRLALVLAGGTAVAASASLAIAALGGSGQLPLTRVLLEAVGMQLAAIMCALLLDAERGACVFAGTLLGSLVVQQRFPNYALFPLTPDAPAWTPAGTAWVAIMLITAGAIIALSRDPASRRYPTSSDR